MSNYLAVCRAPGRIRTCDTRFRRAVLYPLSYEGGPGLSGRLSLSRGGEEISLETRSLRKRRVGPRSTASSGARGGTR